ncbi:MAG TPA: universal stress protein [Marmoricola sp.]|nr:universal stress protein [Marmoricola sp.]
MRINDIPAGAVVVGVDGSHDSATAAAWAARHASNERRDLVVLCSSGTQSAAPDVLDVVTRIIAEHPSVRVHTLVTRENPRESLLEASLLASVVVVGSRGMGPITSKLLGSVGAAVVRHGHCPVVVVRPHHPGKVRRGILVAVDGTPGSTAVLELAFRQAASKGLPLTVLHTEWDEFVPAQEMAADDPDYPVTALTLAESLAGHAEKFPEVRVTQKILRGAPRDAILRYADEMDLVVVGHGRQDPVSRVLFGSVALGVLEHASTVVAVVPVG